MKSMIKFFGVIAFVAVIGFSMAGCKEDETDPTPQTVKYKGAGAKKSAGKVDSVSGSVLTLKPSREGAATFTATVSGNNLANLSGNTIWDDGTTFTAPGALTGGSTGGDNGEDTTFDSQQLVGKWQATSWETLVSSKEPYKVAGFSYIPQATDPNSVVCIYHRYGTDVNSGGGSRSWPINDYYSWKHNIFYFHGYGKDENVPLFSCSVSGDTLTLTAIKIVDENVGLTANWDIKAGEVFFTGKKVEKFAWEK